MSTDNKTMPQVTLKELKIMNDWLPLRYIRVKPEQRRYTTNLIMSFMQSRHPAVTTFTIHASEDDTLVGYVMLIHAENPAQWIIERLTIHRDYQRQGYGYATADKLIDMVYEMENSEMVIARYDPDNDVARELFAKLKFEEQDTLVRKRNIALLEFEFEESEDDDDTDDSLEHDDEDNASDDDEKEKDDEQPEPDTEE